MNPASVRALGRRWLAAMHAGDWEAAWQATDALEAARRAAGQGAPRAAHHLTWDGTPPDGRILRVRCEHGLGDTLQSLRFLPALAARARALHLMVQPPLLPLLQGVPGIGTVHDGWMPASVWPDAEVELEITELAYALRAQPRHLPPADPGLAARLPALDLPAEAALRIGLVWTAGPWDPGRSVPLEALQPLLALPGLRWFGLQQGPALDDPRLRGLPITPLWQRTADIAQCAAALRGLDAAVLVDGMPAHLAGLLGRPAWLLLLHAADWRWGQGPRTPWYPSLRLVRQPAPGDWPGAVAALATQLAAWRRGARPTPAGVAG